MNSGLRARIERRLGDVLSAEGGEPGSSIHGWRCEYPDRYGPCECVDEVARAQLAAILPLLSGEEG